MEPTKELLLDLNERIRKMGYQLHSIMTEIDSLSGLIAAWDSDMDQDVIDQGKMLKNQVERDLFKEKLKDVHKDYRIIQGQLLDLRQNKLMIMYERDSLKSELDIHLTDIKRHISKMDSDTIILQIDQTNYVQSIKQHESFSK